MSVTSDPARTYDNHTKAATATAKFACHDHEGNEGHRPQVVNLIDFFCLSTLKQLSINEGKLIGAFVDNCEFFGDTVVSLCSVSHTS